MSEFEDIKGILQAASTPEVAEQPEQEVVESTEEVEVLAEGEEKTDELEEVVDEFNIDNFDVKQLAEQIDIDPADLYKMKINLSVNGSAEPVELGTIKDTFQQISVEKTELETKLAQQEEKIQQAQQSVQQNSAISENELKAFAEMQNVQAHFNAINWQEEESIDPGNAALMRQKMHERYQMAQGQIQQAQQLKAQQRQQYMATAHQKLLEMMPEWKDDTVKRNEQDMIRQSLSSNGFNNNEIDSINDPRVLVLARKLAQYEQQANEVQEVAKKVRKAPNKLRGINGRYAKKSTDKDKAVERQRKHPSKQNEFEAVKALLAGR